MVFTPSWILLFYFSNFFPVLHRVGGFFGFLVFFSPQVYSKHHKLDFFFIFFKKANISNTLSTPSLHLFLLMFSICFTTFGLDALVCFVPILCLLSSLRTSWQTGSVNLLCRALRQTVRTQWGRHLVAQEEQVFIIILWTYSSLVTPPFTSKEKIWTLLWTLLTRNYLYNFDDIWYMSWCPISTIF